ncbi:MAG: hypothetical protein ACLPV8_25985 [Steroidobacteraceae bacterium]
MRRYRTLTLALALLLILVLPLQGFATASSCGPFNSVAAASQHCSHGSAAVQHHGCGTCCSAAIVLAPVHFAPPRSQGPRHSLPAPTSPPFYLLDRLDRPPRIAP